MAVTFEGAKAVRVEEVSRVALPDALTVRPSAGWWVWTKQGDITGLQWRLVLWW